MYDGNRTIDLHAHTTASDGDHAPAQLVALAARLGLTALAVTDHDTTAGLAEAIEAGRREGVEIVPGVELSAEFPRGQCHILGFFVEPDAPELCIRLQQVRDNRNRRNALIIGRLNELGIAVTIEEVQREADGDVVARPHFARVLVSRGVVSNIQEAFDRFLAKGASAYVDRDRLTPQESIDLIHSAGGIAVIAHPKLMRREAADTEVEIARLQEMGMDGIEARYNLHDAEETARYLALAERLGMVTSGGSDYHGPTLRPSVQLGHVEGHQPAPTALLADLKSARPAARPATNP
jgi:predicted metal-dependent phosphoesterase TrpH